MAVATNTVPSGRGWARLEQGWFLERTYLLPSGRRLGFQRYPVQKRQASRQGCREARIAMSKIARNSKISERRIESALAPGRFISDNVSFDFVRGLEAIENEISKLVRSDSKQGASLYESFLAGCYEKAEELNGSAWSFGQFVRELFCGWIKARQASRADLGDTAARLVAWMDGDPYGFCHRLEKDAVEVLNKTGLAALEKLIRRRFEAATPTEPVPGISPWPSQDYQRRRSSEILRTIYISRRDIASYITPCKATRPTEPDCQTLATMLLARRKPADALSWVERGLRREPEIKPLHGGGWEGSRWISRL